MICFSSHTQIVVSDNLAEDLLHLINGEQSQHITLIVDDNLMGQESILSVISLLKGKLTVSIEKIKAIEPTTDMVNEYCSKLRNKKIDMFVGIGGGSVLDLTKALSVMVVNEGKVEDYHGTGRNFTAGIKKILVPSTAGTGSEVTPGAVLVNKATKFKRSIGGKYVAANYAVLNASLTMSMPDSIIASTGLDALSHAIESYTAKNANDITRMYSKEAFRLIYNNLSSIFEDRENIALRNAVLLGSCLVGFAIFNSNTGACHSISYALGIYHDIPHGVAVGYLMPEVIKVNVEKGCLLYADLYDLIEGRELLSDKKVKAERFAVLFKQYQPLAYISKKFKDYGLDNSNYKFTAERGLDLTPALSNNPVEFTLSDSERVMKELIG